MANPFGESDATREARLLRWLLEDIFDNWRTVDLSSVTDAERTAIEYLRARETNDTTGVHP